MKSSMRDVEEDEPDNVRMVRVCLPPMNWVIKDLKFSAEVPDDFDKKRLPTLDFVILMMCGIIYHSYYEKPMYTLMQMILSNELVRRLSNIHRDVVASEMQEVQNVSQLKSSRSGDGRNKAGRSTQGQMFYQFVKTAKLKKLLYELMKAT